MSNIKKSRLPLCTACLLSSSISEVRWSISLIKGSGARMLLQIDLSRSSKTSSRQCSLRNLWKRCSDRKSCTPSSRPGKSSWDSRIHQSWGWTRPPCLNCLTWCWWVSSSKLCRLATQRRWFRSRSSTLTRCLKWFIKGLRLTSWSKSARLHSCS